MTGLSVSYRGASAGDILETTLEFVVAGDDIASASSVNPSGLGLKTTAAVAVGSAFAPNSTDYYKKLVFLGTETQVNDALTKVTYYGSANFYGQERLRIETDAYTGADANNLGTVSGTDTDSLALVITPVNDPPVLTGPSAAQSVSEDKAFNFNSSLVPANALTLNDIDLVAGTSNELLELTLWLETVTDPPSATCQPTPAWVSLRRGTLSALDFTTGDGEMDSSSKLTTPSGQASNGWEPAAVFRGSLRQLQLSLEDVVVTPPSVFCEGENAVHDGTVTLRMRLSDLGNIGPVNGTAEVTEYSVELNFVAENDAPLHLLPPSQTALEDATGENVLVFSSDTTDGRVANAIVVTDEDAASTSQDDVRTTVAVSQGTLSLRALTNGETRTGIILAAGDGVDESSITLTGAMSDINRELDGLSYTPAAGTSGAVTLTITTNDLGHSPGPALETTDTLTITVEAVNDPPSISGPNAVGVLEDGILPFSGSLAISLNDIDATASALLELSLSVTVGEFSLSAVSGPTYVLGDGTNDADVVVRGTVSKLNQMLGGLTYRPPPMPRATRPSP